MADIRQVADYVWLVAGALFALTAVWMFIWSIMCERSFRRSMASLNKDHGEFMARIGNKAMSTDTAIRRVEREEATQCRILPA